jgi:integrase
LGEAALDIVRTIPRMDGSPLLFTAPRGGAFSNMAISAVMRRMQSKAAEAGDEGWLDEVSRRPAVPHGLRSTFRTWAAEAGVDHAIAEMALGHQVGSAVERAYNRSGMVEARRGVMSEWAKYLTAPGKEVEGRST